MHQNINKICKILHQGGIIVYPTEGVYGLGCDPFNETAVERVLKIKKRNITKGLILIASSWQQVKDLINLDLAKCSAITANKKLPITWIFPATPKTPKWIRGKFNSVAIRVTLHPIAKKICQKFGGPIISTSANFSQKPPMKNFKQVQKQFGAYVDYVVSGSVGQLKKPTKICDVVTSKIIRA